LYIIYKRNGKEKYFTFFSNREGNLNAINKDKSNIEKSSEDKIIEAYENEWKNFLGTANLKNETIDEKIENYFIKILEKKDPEISSNDKIVILPEIENPQNQEAEKKKLFKYAK
jgi:hypothetical protein